MRTLKAGDIIVGRPMINYYMCLQHLNGSQPSDKPLWYAIKDRYIVLELRTGLTKTLTKDFVDNFMILVDE